MNLGTNKGSGCFAENPESYVGWIRRSLQEQLFSFACKSALLVLPTPRVPRGTWRPFFMGFSTNRTVGGKSVPLKFRREILYNGVMDMKDFKFDARPYKYKNPVKRFFCPLCGVERAFNLSHRLTPKHYFQMIIVTAFTTLLLFPFMEWEGLFSFFAVWAIFELGIRMAFRKEIPCPHCGFDASWYKKDVKMARKLVKDFWRENGVVDEDGQSAPGQNNSQASQIQEPTQPF